MESAQQQNPDGTVTSISLCAVADGQPLVFYRAGPCGGGCAGIPTIATLQQVGTLKIVATIQPTGDGAYFACSPLLLSKTGLLFLSCLGEGTAIIRRVNMSNGEVSIILRCTMPPTPSACVIE